MFYDNSAFDSIICSFPNKKAMVHTEYGDLMADYMTKLCRERREEAIAAGSLRRCSHCKKKTSKKCSGCYIVYWCRTECLKSGWEDHREGCRVTEGH